MTSEERAMILLGKHEKKLIELMGAEAYYEWALTIAKEVFLSEIEGMADNPFKNFVLDHFDEITGMDNE